MFLISTDGDQKKINNWRCDQYRWAVNNGTVIYPNKKDGVVKKQYHKMTKQGTFVRHGWWLLDNPHLVLVHYLGDHNEYLPQPHGNSKTHKRPHIRTCPSVIQEIKENASAADIPSTTYQRMINEVNTDAGHEAVLRG